MATTLSTSLTAQAAVSAAYQPAADAVNQIGIELLTRNSPQGNALLSPYSIQSALAMTYAGADGETKKEMARVLHFSEDEQKLHAAFVELQKQLAAITEKTSDLAKRNQQRGGPTDPILLVVANRLFGQSGYEFRPTFLDFVKDRYAAPLQTLEFAADPPGARQIINTWVEDKTRQRIKDLIPADGIDKETRLVLVNAVYLKAPWAAAFLTNFTEPASFRANGTKDVQVPTMSQQAAFGYEQHDGFAAVTLPYLGGEVHLLILLPDSAEGLPALESKLTSGLLASCAAAKSQLVRLYLPKFKVQPPLFRLSNALQSLGMKSAFDKPRGSANFDRMAPRRSDEYLFISEVFHKTFLELDERGTEAAAATAVVMARAAAIVGERPKPIEVRVDRPFLYAIQHRPSGACLFLGRMMDPS